MNDDKIGLKSEPLGNPIKIRNFWNFRNKNCIFKIEKSYEYMINESPWQIFWHYSSIVISLFSLKHKYYRPRLKKTHHIDSFQMSIEVS